MHHNILIIPQSSFRTHDKKKKKFHDIITQQKPRRKSLPVSTELSFELEMLYIKGNKIKHVCDHPFLYFSSSVQGVDPYSWFIDGLRSFH